MELWVLNLRGGGAQLANFPTTGLNLNYHVIKRMRSFLNAERHGKQYASFAASLLLVSISRSEKSQHPVIIIISN